MSRGACVLLGRRDLVAVAISWLDDPFDGVDTALVKLYGPGALGGNCRAEHLR
jgi:hypothetical protein